MIAGGILSGGAIEAAIKTGDINISPFTAANINPASYDLTLGNTAAVYSNWVLTARRWRLREALSPIDGGCFEARRNSIVADIKEEQPIEKFKITDQGWVLKPGIGYLMHTVERISTMKYEPVIDGKSSTGRLFIKVHETAGYGDPGFDGQYTLEVTVVHPIRVYAGMRVAQIRFHTLHGDIINPYAGNYVGEAAKGPVASRAWRQFK